MLLNAISLIKMICVLVIILSSTTFLGSAATDTNYTPMTDLQNKTMALGTEQKSVKKELKVNLTNKAIVEITPANVKDSHTEKLFIIDEKSLINTTGNILEQQQTVLKDKENRGILKATSKTDLIQQQRHQHQPVNEDFVLSDEDDISESLKTGFYFFLILSSGAIIFIIFKIYRLRLSRAERKYGVQGDRTNQELTPLPISIEDGHSDDEDQTLFEIQRQNIRIL